MSQSSFLIIADDTPFFVDLLFSALEEMGDDRQEALVMAMCAESAKRYDDMAAAMKQVAKTGQPFTPGERKLFRSAFTNVANARRSSLKRISSIDQDSEPSEMTKVIAKEYRGKIVQELTEICLSVLRLLNDDLIPSANDQNNTESHVFYLTMKGDFFRYMAEIATGTTRNELVKKTASIYMSAKSIADEGMLPTHPFRLDLYLNYSVFMYETEDKRSEARLLAKEAIQGAKSQLDSRLPNEWCDETTHALQLLKDNISLWKAESD